MPRLLAAVFALTFAAPVLGQGLQKVSIQTDSPRPQSLPTTTLRTGTQLVIVDVVVTDKGQHPVHNLKAEDFTLLEGSVPQEFKSFEEHTALTDAELAKIPAPAKLPPGVFSNFVTTQADGPLNILLLDRLNTPVENQSEMKTQINEYLATARPGARMAIFGLADHLLLLQGFTDDPELLRAAVNKKGSFYISPLRDDNIGGEGNSEKLKPSDISGDEMLRLYGGKLPENISNAIQMMKMFETINTSSQTQQRTQRTLDAMNSLARYLAALPGRKNLIWFSGSFPIDIMPDLNKNMNTSYALTGHLASASSPYGNMVEWANSPLLGTASAEKEFYQTTALLSRGQVAVYPIDARGLATISNFNAANVATSTGLSGRQGPASTTLEKDLITYGEQTTDEHATMYAMADDTGGKAAVDTNGLRQAVEDAIADGANYYTIAYTPTDSNWNGAFRRIQVKLKQQGYSLSYRKGYFADDPDALGSSKGDLAAAAAPVSSAMRLALTHGGPQPTQLMFTARVLPVSANTESDLAPGNTAGKVGKVPYRRYRVDFAIDPRAIHFTQGADGNRHETLEFVTHVYDAEGNLVDSVGTSIKTTVTPAEYEQFRRTGLPFHHEVSVPAKGDYFLRIAMHDVEADQVGAIELPVASVQGLQPMAAAASSPVK